MKQLRLNYLSLITLLVSVIMLVSCTVDNEATTENTLNKNANSFLKSFYKNDFDLGQSAIINSGSKISLLARTALLEEVELTEVFVDNQTKARGYIITGKKTGEFLYFIDVDRNTYVLTTLDVKNSEQKTFNNIDEIYNYFSTDEFDFIEIALDDTYSSSSKDGRFWGWQSWSGPCNKDTGESILMETYYVVGIGVKTRKVVGLDGGDIIQPCGGGALLDD